MMSAASFDDDVVMGERNDDQKKSPRGDFAARNDDLPATSEAISDEAAAKDKKRPRVPRRIIHCSDGVVEEYSTDEQEDEDREESDAAGRRIDPKRLAWIPWVVHFSWVGGAKLLGLCDFLGEKIAWTLGITSPKYYYELQEFKRMQLEEEERRRRQDVESRGWREGAEEELQRPVELDPSKLKRTTQLE